MNMKVRNKITGEIYEHVGKPKVFIDGIAFEQVKRPMGRFDRDSSYDQIFKVRADSLEKIR